MAGVSTSSGARHLLFSLSQRVSFAARTVATATYKDIASPVSPQFPAYKGPRAACKPHAITIHGDTRIDKYYWFRDDERKAEDVLAVCNAENEHVLTAMSGTEALQERLYKEIRARIKEEDTSLPGRDTGYYYYTKTETDKQYGIHCRRKIREEFVSKYTPNDCADNTSCYDEELVLDENLEAEGQKYYVVAGFQPSKSHRFMAYSVDNTGDELFTIRFFDTDGARKTNGNFICMQDEVANTTGSFFWINDSHVVYTTRDSTMRPDQVWLHEVGSDKPDVLLYHEKDPEFFAGAWMSRTRKCIYVASAGSVTSQMFIGPSEVINGTVPLLPVMTRTPHVEYHISDHGNDLFVLTNADKALNNKLLIIRNGLSVALNLIAVRDDVKLDDVTFYARHLVISERSSGLPNLRVFKLDSVEEEIKSLGEGNLIVMPDASYTLVERPLEYESPILRYTYTSFTTPPSQFDLDMDQPSSCPVLRKQTPVLGGFNADDYVSDRVWVTSHDGVQVPLSIVYHRRLPKQPNPVLLEGYGSYEISNDCCFSRSLISLLDRGVVVSVAHVRGGGEMGRNWYENGKYLMKENTWKDFHACALHLINEGIADKDKQNDSYRICIEGRSAGGLLIGASLNTAPKRDDGKPFYAAALTAVPFVDVLTTMLDDSIPLTTREWEEWGNPHNLEYYNYMKSYSPIDNVSPNNGPYPPIFIQSGLFDPRVAYWEPLKYAHVLRDAGAPTVILKLDMSSGHFASSGRFDRLKDTAIEYAFVLRALDMESVDPYTSSPRQDGVSEVS
eukprot:gene6339-9267_t